MSGLSHTRTFRLGIACLLISASAHAQQAADGVGASCAIALDTMVSILRRDYPAYQDRVPGHETAFGALVDSVRTVVAPLPPTDYQTCIPSLRRILGFFGDHHAAIWQAAPPAPRTDSATPVRPAPTVSIAPDDPLRPRILSINDSTMLLRIPTLDYSFKPTIDSLLAKNWSRLTSTDFLIVDLRGDRGGCTCSYDTIIPLLYDGPLHEEGVDVWSSIGTVAFYESWLDTPGLPVEVERQIQSILPEMRAHLGHFVEWARDTTIARDSVYPTPRRIAVLVDSGCASSCEDFVLLARQSGKVTVIGKEHTAGALDYGNLNKYVWLPGWRRMVLATTRAHHTRDHPLDMAGLEPGFKLPQDTKEVVASAAGYLWGLNH